MKFVKVAVAAAALAALAACGGGGGSAGSNPFKPNNGTTDTTGGVSKVSSGVANQKSISLSVEKYGLDWSADGVETTVTVRVTDTAGNPVPAGTLVQFSSEGGQIQKSCALTGIASGKSTISGCSVTFSTQNRRPADGYIAILAWLQGEEAYIDSNGNGKYDGGEPFWDAGRLFRDDNESGTYEPVNDELNVAEAVNGGALGIGSSACAVPAGHDDYLNADSIPLSVPSTCDGVWGKTLIRARTVLPLSDPRAMGVEAIEGKPGTALVFSEYNQGRRTAAPSGTTISVTGMPKDCTVTVSPSIIPPGAVVPTVVTLTSGGTGCASGQQVTVAAKFGDYEVPGFVQLK